MSNKYRKSLSILVLTILFLPVIVFAKTEDISFFFGAVFMEAFVSIHMSFFVLLPLSTIFAKDGNTKSLFWKLFFGRVIILLFFDLIIPQVICIIDFLSVFVGAFLLVPILSSIFKKNLNSNISSNIEAQIADATIVSQNNRLYKCLGCGTEFRFTEKKCPNCQKEVETQNEITSNLSNKIVKPDSYDPMYSFSEKKMVDKFIMNALEKADINLKNHYLPRDFLKRKNILCIIFYILIFVFVSSIFFHFPITTYLIFIIVLFVYFILLLKYNLLSYLRKELKSRPSEKIQNIIAGVKANFVIDSYRSIRKVLLIVSIVLPLFIFYNPRIMYERTTDGYGVRFYTFGLSNFTSAVIPETHNNLLVTSLRGNTFSNMPLLRKVTLPDSIIEIRGQAFANDFALEDVNIPNKLEYLGGGAFRNCISLREVKLPNTLTFMGGETFYNAVSLEKIVLSENITEIRGNSFERCIALGSIEIPDAVTRIGGHAFYGDYNLSEVKFTENSSLNEIGSSAFRLCSNLRVITLPKNVSINERAFKESPTIIKHFGDADVNNYDYKHFSYHTYTYTNESFNINQYYSDSTTYNKYLTYTGYFASSGMYKYNFEYNDGEKIEKFSLDYYTQGYNIGDNLFITLANPNNFLTFNGTIYVEVRFS